MLENRAGANEWRMAAGLVARMTVGFGAALVAMGVYQGASTYRDSHRGLEVLANIDAAINRGLGASGQVDLSWQEPSGVRRQARGVAVTGGLGRKLRLGNVLSRAQLRIRYQPGSERSSVVVIEDVPEQIKRAAALSIAGFMAMTGGSLLMLAMLLVGRLRAATKMADTGARRDHGS